MLVNRNEYLEDLLLTELMDADKDDTRQHPSVTDLIYCLTQKFYNMELGDKKPEPTRQTKLFFSLGLGLEKVLLVNRKMTKTVGEYEGIHYHVDSLDGFNTPLMEVKTTRTSPSKPFTELPDGWMKQAMAYCKANNTRKIEFAVLYIIQADIRCWEVEFEQEEIDTNWNWLLSRKKVWDEAVANHTQPQEYKYNQPWECKSCSYSLICEVRSLARKQND